MPGPCTLKAGWCSTSTRWHAWLSSGERTMLRSSAFIFHICEHGGLMGLRLCEHKRHIRRWPIYLGRWRFATAYEKMGGGKGPGGFHQHQGWFHLPFHSAFPPSLTDPRGPRYTSTTTSMASRNRSTRSTAANSPTSPAGWGIREETFEYWVA
jgi:hypothetical protein